MRRTHLRARLIVDPTGTSTKPYQVEQPCPKCKRKLYQGWIVGGGKPSVLAPELHCAYCELTFPKE